MTIQIIIKFYFLPFPLTLGLGGKHFSKRKNTDFPYKFENLMIVCRMTYIYYDGIISEKNSTYLLREA